MRRLISDGLEVHFTFSTHEDEARKMEAEEGARAHQVNFEETWSPPELSLDVLVNNAGVNLSGRPFFNDDREVLQRTFLVNVDAAVRLATTYAPGMIERHYGRIVNINSIYGYRGPAKRMSYVASKFALRGATLSMSRDLAAYGITVNEVNPGPVRSRMLDSMGQAAVGEGRFDSLADYYSDVIEGVPIGSLIAPEDIANVVSFLSQPAARAITGVSIPVDGGILAG